MQTQEIVELKRFSSEYLEELRTFELPKQQSQYTSLPDKLLGKVSAGQYPVVILADTIPVGFFLLNATERVKEYSDNPKAMLLTSLSLNWKKQGKGYAKRGMQLLAEFVRMEFKNCNEIILAVNHKNKAAQQLYLTIGFQDTGRRKNGRLGEQFILNRCI